MSKITLNYKIINPNSVDDTVELLLQLFMEVNKPKVDEAIKNAVNNTKNTTSHPVWEQDGFTKILNLFVSRIAEFN